MAYIGNTVQNQGFSPAVDYFNGDGTTVTFTLSRPVASVAQLTAVIENVIQNPSTAFTVSGNQITFTSAPPSGSNNIWVEYTSLITTYAALSQDPTVIGDITATGGYSSTGDYGQSFVDGVIMDYVTGNARITTGASDGVTIYNGGTASRTALMTLGATGNVGVGVTPSAWSISPALQVSRASLYGSASQTILASNWYYGSGDKYIGNGYASLYQQINGQHQWQTAASGTAGNAITFTQAMTLDASGNLGIGTSSPQQKLDVRTASGVSQIRVGRNDSDSFTYGIGRDNDATGYMTFYGNQTGATGYIFTGVDGERMRIDSSGNLLVGTTSATIGTDNGLVAFKRANSGYSLICGSAQTGSVSYMIKFTYDNTTGTGQISTTNTTVSYATSSDYRLKENIAPMTGALATVSALKPVTYNWKVDGSDGQGFIAHELQEVVPDCVTGEKDAVDAEGNIQPQAVDTSFLVATLTAAIQEQQAIITDLKARIEALENK